jgi:hypothetical protein
VRTSQRLVVEEKRRSVQYLRRRAEPVVSLVLTTLQSARPTYVDQDGPSLIRSITRGRKPNAYHHAWGQKKHAARARI